jgi:hypothetical protein
VLFGYFDAAAKTLSLTTIISIQAEIRLYLNFSLGVPTSGNHSLISYFEGPQIFSVFFRSLLLHFRNFTTISPS